jgi:hypothetical protein
MVFPFDVGGDTFKTVTDGLKFFDGHPGIFS